MIRKLVVIAVVIIAIMAAVWLIRGRGNGDEEEVELQTAEVTRAPLRVTVSATGVLEPWTRPGPRPTPQARECRRLD